LTGTVIDSKDGSSISNVSVIAKGTHIGAQTDVNGNFRLTVPLSVKILTISYVGFSSREVDISRVGNIKVALVAASSILNDVVIIGYGTAKKKDLTGALGSVPEKDFNKGSFTSPDLLIQGKVSGVQIITNNGQPGSATTVKIRGQLRTYGHWSTIICYRWCSFRREIAASW